jgi:hypothetical protein
MSRENPLWRARPASTANYSNRVSTSARPASHYRRRIVHFNVTAHPIAEWTAQQLREAFPFDKIPRYLLRDRDRIYDGEFPEDVKAVGFKEVLTAPQRPWNLSSARFAASASTT